MKINIIADGAGRQIKFPDATGGEIRDQILSRLERSLWGVVVEGVVLEEGDELDVTEFGEIGDAFRGEGAITVIGVVSPSDQPRQFPSLAESSPARLSRLRSEAAGVAGRRRHLRSGHRQSHQGPPPSGSPWFRSGLCGHPLSRRVVNCGEFLVIVIKGV
ncbi:hypothetical protein Droror1_Dr00026780 [Drosera rotundifolia]